MNKEAYMQYFPILGGIIPGMEAGITSKVNFITAFRRILKAMRTALSLLVFGGILAMAFTGCKNEEQVPPDDGTIPVLNYSYINSYPHDTNSFTEGLLISNDSLFESTGSPSTLPQTRSVFGPVDLATGKISVRVELDEEKYYGEGIAYLEGKFFQLTYKNKIGFVYDAATYQTIGQFSFLSDEGWGLTTDGESLIMSDGTDKLTFIDPRTFLVKKLLFVTEKGSSKRYLNELEFIQGYIYANVWFSNTIIKIDPASGKEVGLIDLTSLAEEAKSIYSGSQEMNGIAYDPFSGEIYITGKLWPRIYQIRLSR